MIFLDQKVWSIKKTDNKGRGLFAKRDIGAGVVVGDYLGKVIRTAEYDILEDEKNLYLMYYSDQASILPDLQKEDIHLVNHSCAPNLWMSILKGHTLFFALRHIFEGEELTVSYMLSPQDEYCKPCSHACKCESAVCTNSMHLSDDRYKKWNKFKKINAQKSRKQKIKYGEDLSPLSAYPKNIADDPIYSLFGYEKAPSYKCSDNRLLSVKKIRELIRESGRTLEFPKLDLKIYGVVDNLIISNRTLG